MWVCLKDVNPYYPLQASDFYSSLKRSLKCKADLSFPNHRKRIKSMFWRLIKDYPGPVDHAFSDSPVSLALIGIFSSLRFADT